MGDVVDIESAGGDVGRDQKLAAMVLEGEHYSIANTLAQVAVEGLDIESAILEIPFEPRSTDLCPAEEDRLLGVLFLVGAVLLLQTGRKAALAPLVDETLTKTTVFATVAGSFGVIALAEWGDLTQIATASLSAKNPRASESSALVRASARRRRWWASRMSSTYWSRLRGNPRPTASTRTVGSTRIPVLADSVTMRVGSGRMPRANSVRFMAFSGVRGPRRAATRLTRSPT